MVIYHTAPLRCFPLLVEEMAGKFANSYHFRMPFAARSVADHRYGMLHHVFAYDHSMREVPRRSIAHNGFPHDILDNGVDFVHADRLRPIDFLYGVFDGRLVQRREGDYVFTVMSDPVRHIYDLYHYLRFMTRHADAVSRRAEGVEHFDDMVGAGLCRFVDRFLDGDRSIAIGGRTYDLVDDFFRVSPTVEYDYVGVESRIDRVLATLSDRLGIDLIGSERLHARRSSLDEPVDYRCNELRASLRAEIERYEAAGGG